MALSSVSPEEFSFPLLPSQDSSQFSGSDSPPLWKHSPENDHNRFLTRLATGKDDGKDQTKSFSYVERKSLWTDKTEERMDMLWEVLNEELPQRSQSLRIDHCGEKKPSLFPCESSNVTVECGMKLTKKASPKKISTNVLVLMRVLKKLLVMRSSSRRLTAKTHRYV